MSITQIILVAVVVVLVIFFFIMKKRGGQKIEENTPQDMGTGGQTENYQGPDNQEPPVMPSEPLPQ